MKDQLYAVRTNGPTVNVVGPFETEEETQEWISSNIRFGHTFGGRWVVMIHSQYRNKATYTPYPPPLCMCDSGWTRDLCPNPNDGISCG